MSHPKLCGCNVSDGTTFLGVGLICLSFLLLSRVQLFFWPTMWHFVGNRPNILVVYQSWAFKTHQIVGFYDSWFLYWRERSGARERKKFDMDDESIACSWIHSSIRPDTQSSLELVLRCIESFHPYNNSIRISLTIPVIYRYNNWAARGSLPRLKKF